MNTQTMCSKKWGGLHKDHRGLQVIRTAWVIGRRFGRRVPLRLPCLSVSLSVCLSICLHVCKRSMQSSSRWDH